MENALAFLLVISAAWFIYTLVQQRNTPPPPPPTITGSDSKTNQAAPAPRLRKYDARLVSPSGVWRGGRNYPKPGKITFK